MSLICQMLTVHLTVATLANELQPSESVTVCVSNRQHFNTERTMRHTPAHTYTHTHLTLYITGGIFEQIRAEVQQHQCVLDSGGNGFGIMQEEPYSLKHLHMNMCTNFQNHRLLWLNLLS